MCSCLQDLGFIETSNNSGRGVGTTVRHRKGGVGTLSSSVSNSRRGVERLSSCHRSVSFLVSFLAVEGSGCRTFGGVSLDHGIFCFRNCVPRQCYRGAIGNLRREFAITMAVDSIPRSSRGRPILLGGGSFTTPIRRVARVCTLPNGRSVSPGTVVTFFCCYFFNVVFSSTNCNLVVFLTALFVLLGYGPRKRGQGAIVVCVCYNVSAVF